MGLTSKSKKMTIEQLKQAIEVTSLGVWEWELDTDFVFISDNAFKLLGIKPENFDYTMTYVVGKLVHSKSRMKFMKAMAQVRRESRANNGIYRVNNPVKDPCWIKFYSQVILDTDSKASKVVGTFMDVTEEYLSKRALEGDLEFLDTIFQTIPSPICYKNTRGKYQFFNKAFLEFLGKDQFEVLDHTMDQIIPENFSEMFRCADEELLASQKPQSYEGKVPHADGSIHTVLFNRAVHLDKKNHLKGTVSVMQDITQQKSIEREVDMFYKAKDVFLDINRNMMKYKDYKEFFGDMQVKVQNIFDRSIRSTVLEYHDDKTLTILINSGYEEEGTRSFKLPVEESFMWDASNGLPQKTVIINDIEDEMTHGNRAIKIKDGRVAKSVLMIPLYVEGCLKWILSFESDKNKIFDEIDEFVAEYIREELPIVIRMYELYRKTLMLSRYDGLTGLMNRRYFEYVFEEKINRAFYNKEQLVIVLFDLDGLKRVNDTFGHQAGDTYIKEFVEALKIEFDLPDMLARIGGDEFTAIFEKADMALLVNRIEIIRQTFQNKVLGSEGNTFHGSFSYGLAIYPDDSKNMSELQKIADEKMYKDKQSRRNNG
jgi:diguanylate cyclase (GGDEF)-like protein/PAS domain S-box-containing protein